MSEGRFATLESDDDACGVSKSKPAKKQCGMIDSGCRQDSVQIRISEAELRDDTLYPAKEMECSQLVSVANIQSILNQLDAARENFSHALMVADEWLPRDGDITIEILRKLTGVELLLGNNKHAKNLAERFLKVVEGRFGDASETADALELVAQANQCLRWFGWADLYYQKALVIRQAHGGKDLQTATLLRKIGSLCFDKQEYKQAEVQLQKAHCLRAEIGLTADAETARIFQQLGAVCCAMCRYKESEKYLNKALRLYRKCKGADSVEVAYTRCELAKVFWATQRLDKAAKWLKAALRIQEAKLGLKDRTVKGTVAKLSGVYYAQGKLEKSAELSKLVMETGLRADGS